MCKEPDISKVDQVSTFILLREDPRPKATAFTFILASPMCRLQSCLRRFMTQQSLKKGKATDQLIIDYRGVQIKAAHIKLGTKETLALGDAARNWNPDLEIDPADALAPAYHCGISVPEGVWEAHSQEPSFEHYRSRTIRLLEENLTPITPSDVTEPGGVAPQAPETPPPHIPVSGDAPSHSWSASASSNAGDTWLGTEGSLGPEKKRQKIPRAPSPRRSPKR